MGTIKKGILGGFSGKVGTVIGGSWNSISYMRSLPVGFKDPKTEGQLCQRGRFAAAVNFVKNIAPYVAVGYKLRERGQSPYSAAMSYILRYAVEGCGDEAAVNFTKAKVSNGSLALVGSPEASVSEGKVTFAWTDNSGQADALGTDVAMLLVYNKDRQEAMYDLEAGTRADATAELSLPTYWGADDALAVYLSFRSADGKNVSSSLCLQDDGVTASQPGGGTGGEDGGEDGDDEDLFG